MPFGSNAIIKLSPPEYPYLVENEASCYQLPEKNKLSIKTATATILVDKNGRPGLLVQRFDRSPAPDSRLFKYPVEDAAQLLNIWPAQKYDPSYEDIALKIAEVTTSPPLALRNISFQIAYAWLTGNGDLHAKNFSVIDYGRGYEMSPIYDIPSTVPYGDTTLALEIQGSRSGLSAKKFLSFCGIIGLTEKTSHSIINSALAITETAASSIISSCQFDPRKRRDIMRILKNRREMWTI